MLQICEDLTVTRQITHHPPLQISHIHKYTDYIPYPAPGFTQKNTHTPCSRFHSPRMIAYHSLHRVLTTSCLRFHSPIKKSQDFVWTHPEVIAKILLISLTWKDHSIFPCPRFYLHKQLTRVIVNRPAPDFTHPERQQNDFIHQISYSPGKKNRRFSCSRFRSLGKIAQNSHPTKI